MSNYISHNSDRWNDYEEYDFDDNSSDYTELDNAAVEALTVHLGRENYFETYAE